MVTTDAGLCNLALASVGQRELIDSLNEPTTQAQLCKVLYPQARDCVLAAAWWEWVKARATLALTLEEREGWTYCYAQPADCLSPRYIYAGMRMPPADLRVPFSPELNDARTGTLICADLEEASLVYTPRFEVVALMPPLFVEAVQLDLASRLAAALKVAPQEALALRREARNALLVAIADDARKVQTDVEPEAGHIRARG